MPSKRVAFPVFVSLKREFGRSRCGIFKILQGFLDVFSVKRQLCGRLFDLRLLMYFLRRFGTILEVLEVNTMLFYWKVKSLCVTL